MANFPTSVGTNIQTILFRTDTAANWATNNPTLQAGEPGFEVDTNQLKIGNGSTAYNSLPYEAITSVDGNSTLIQVRRQAAAAWTSANPVLASGEWGYETDTGKAKIGDGTTTWTALSYFGGGGTLAGDVTGPAGANTVALVGGVSAGAVATATGIVAAATSAATPSTLMGRDSGGNVAATSFTGALLGNATSATSAGSATTAVSFSGSLAGDVTGTQGATAIAANAVTNAKLAQMTSLTIKGNATGGAANATDLNATSVTAMLNTFTDTLKGMVPPSGGGTVNFLRADGTWTTGAGGVTDVNGLTGSVVVQVGDDSIPSLANNVLAYSSPTGKLDNLNQYVIDAVTKGLSVGLTENPNDGNGVTLNSLGVDFVPLQDSANEQWNANNRFYNIDPTSTGFRFGTGGTAINHETVTFNAQGTGDLGTLNFCSNNFSIGNGTDPFEWKGMGYSYGFGQINNNITLVGAMQGYGFQWNMQPGAIVGPTNVYVSAFYDACNVQCAWNAAWNSFQSTPELASLGNNYNYNGYNASPYIHSLTGNASVFGYNYSPKVDSFTGVFSQLVGLNLNPQTSSVYSAQLIFASLDSVTTFPGVAASLVIQDLTITVNSTGTAGNAVTIEYVGGGTAGSEVVTNNNLAFTVQIQNGVSTATQVNAALNAYIQFSINLTSVVSGTGSNPQVTQGPTSLTGGLDRGNRKIAYLDGDVEITGSLTFGGALSIGQLNAFGQYTLVDGVGSPATVNGVIAQMSCGDNLTLTNVDVIGLNTAGLISTGANTTITSAFLGIAALALPAVISIGANSSIDRISGATFAVSMDGGAGAGSSVGILDLCRAIAIPNGVTSITNLRGYTMDLPFGDPGVTTHGIHMSAASVHNYMAGDLVVGDAGSDIPTNSSVAIEIKSSTKAFRQALMDTTERDALSALAGMEIYNTDTNTVEFYNGTAWV